MANVQLSFDEEEYLLVKSFPVEVFPPALVEIIMMYVNALNLNLDYSCATVLSAYAAAIGSKFSIQVKRGWTELASLFIAIVGRAGINKSGPLSIFTKPLERIDSELFDVYSQAVKEFNKDQKPSESSKVDPPIRKQIVIKDSTQEAFLLALFHNPHGLFGVHDELSSFLKSFNKYRAGGGGDEELILSIFSGKGYSINRKSSEPILIKRPVFNLIGAIPHGSLNRQFEANRNENGFTHRFLFVFPENVKRSALSDIEITEELETIYENKIRSVVGKLSNLNENNVEPKLIRFSEEAMGVYRQLRDAIDHVINNSTSDSICGVYAKLEIYYIRFCLILHVMANDDSGIPIPSQVSAETARNAEKLFDYFRRMALKVNGQVNVGDDPIARFPTRFKEVLNLLPSEFTTEEAWTIFSNATKNKKTMYNYLKQSELFTRIELGKYRREY